MQESKPNVVALVDRMPAADSPNTESKFTGPTPETAEEVFGQILEGGTQSVLELIALVRESTDPAFKNYKPEYALHALAVHVGRSGKEDQRRLVARAIATRLESGQGAKWVQGFLVRQLQVCGDGEAAVALGKRLLDDGLCEYATQALVAIGDGAARQFRQALPKAKGKNRATLIQALGVVRDEQSVAALTTAIRDESRDIRLSAAWALASIGAAGAVDVLLRAADVDAGYERVQTTKACLVLAEKLLAAGKNDAAMRIYTHLHKTRTDPAEQYVRDAAEQALAATG